jgi:hypothetical protein
MIFRETIDIAERGSTPGNPAGGLLRMYSKTTDSGLYVKTSGGTERRVDVHAHLDLTGVTADQHHSRSHDHSVAGDGTALAPVTFTFPAVVYTDWIPALTATTTNPSLGSSGNFAFGTYLPRGKHITGYGRIGFGTTGVSAGSGVYRVSVPIEIRGGWTIVGHGWYLDNSANIIRAFDLVYVTGTTCDMYLNREAASTYQITNSNPWTAGASDQFSYVLDYEAL